MIDLPASCNSKFWFFFLLQFTMEWKSFELWSPSRNHRTLDFAPPRNFLLPQHFHQFLFKLSLLFLSPTVNSISSFLSRVSISANIFDLLASICLTSFCSKFEPFLDELQLLHKSLSKTNLLFHKSLSNPTFCWTFTPPLCNVNSEIWTGGPHPFKSKRGWTKTSKAGIQQKGQWPETYQDLLIMPFRKWSSHSGEIKNLSTCCISEDTTAEPCELCVASVYLNSIYWTTYSFPITELLKVQRTRF